MRDYSIRQPSPYKAVDKEASETLYLMKYRKGEFAIEVQGDKAFVEEKFKELLKLYE